MCENGVFVDGTVCIDPDVCTDNVTQPGMTACGFNDRGFLDERCDNGQWQDTATCVDPDECTDDATQVGTNACGLNGRGGYEQVCTLGTWTDTNTCVDPDACTDNTTQPGSTPCGLNMRGRLDQRCDNGQWSNTATCVDPDECTDNATRDTTVACGFNDRGTWDQSCVAGRWENTRCDECGSVVRTGNVTIDDPTDIAALAGVTQLNGHLTIANSPTLTSLAGLESLACIRNGMDMQYNNYLTSLAGLTVAEVGSIFLSNAGPQFTSLAGLEHLVRVTAGSLAIQLNDGLVNIDELSSLVSVQGSVNLRNENLESLAGLSSLVSAGRLEIGGDSSSSLLDACSVLDLNNITSLTGLENLRRLTDASPTVNISCNPSLTDISALSAVFATSPSVILRRNNALTHLSGMEGFLGGQVSLELGGNASLVDLSALANVARLSSFYVADNDQLPNLQGLSSLARVGTLRVYLNDAMISLEGLEALAAVDSSLEVFQNPALASLSGLESLRGGTPPSNSPNVDLIQLPSLQSVAGLRSLENVSRLKVDRCDQLTSFSGLEALTAIERELAVYQNAKLTSFAGLDNVARMGNNPPGHPNAGTVRIQSNPLLTSLTGLGGLRSTVCELMVAENPLLADISALGNMAGIASTGCGIYGLGQVGIINNDSLTTLTGLEGLTRSQNLRIVGNNQLTSISALANLREVPGILEIGSNVSSSNPLSTDIQPMASLTGLEGLTRVGILTLHGMPNVTSLPAMSNWTGSTQSSLYIDNMVGLTSLDGLEALTALTTLSLGGSWGTHTAANDLPALEDISALGNLAVVDSAVSLHHVNVSLAPLASARRTSSVGISWTIRDSTITGLDGIGAAGAVYGLTLDRVNTATGDLSGLEGLVRVNGAFTVERTALSSLTGLAGLATVTGAVRLNDNDALTTLAGFDNLASLSSLTITNHLLLKQCEANAFHQDLVTNHGFTGSASINGNTGAGTCP